MQSGATLLGQLDVLTLILVAIAAFATALFHSVAGFAGALLLSVCLAPLIGVRAVVPVVALAMIISNSNRILLFRNQIDWKAYRAIMITGLPGIVVGAVIYLYLPVKAIAMVMGCFLLISIPLRRIFKKRNYKVGYRGLSAVAVVYGVISGTVFGGGMILGPFLLVFGVGELLNREMVSLGILVGVFTIPGGLLGKWIVKNTDIGVHTVIVETLMFAGGCYFIYQGFSMSANTTGI